MRNIKYFFLIIFFWNTAVAERFDKSATVNYIKSWYKKELKNANTRLEEAKSRIQKNNKKKQTIEKTIQDNLHLLSVGEQVDEDTLDRAEKEIKDISVDISNDTKRIRNIELLLVNEKILGQPEISKTSMLELLIPFFSLSYANVSPLNESWETIWQMLKREQLYADNYYVVYTANSKTIEKRMMDYLEQKNYSINQCTDECFKTKVFRALKDMTFESLDDAFKQYIFTPEFAKDHDNKHIEHFLSANLSLFGNLHGPESTFGRFAKTDQTPFIAVQYEKNPKFNERLAALQSQKYQILNQIFIQKNIANKVGYISTEYGFPLYNNTDEIKNATTRVLDGFQASDQLDEFTLSPQPNFSLRHKNIGTVLNYNLLMDLSNKQNTAIENIEIPMSSYLDLTSKSRKSLSNLQFRLMYLPKYFSDTKSIMVFDNIAMGQDVLTGE